MSNINDLNIDIVVERIKTIKKLGTLGEIADFLGIVRSTFRNRVTRNAIPYEEIVDKLSAEELAYVMKGQASKGGSFHLKARRLDSDLPGNQVNEDKAEYAYVNHPNHIMAVKEVEQRGHEQHKIDALRKEIDQFIEWIHNMEILLEAMDEDPDETNYDTMVELVMLRNKIRRKADGLD